MVFRGVQKTTLVDYPGEIACTFFLGGCNWRCRYCYNAALVFERDTGLQITIEEALRFLAERKKFLDGVCVTGGEPLRQWPVLAEFLRGAKALGYKVKVDTNGSFPDALADMIQEQLVDYVAMDIKAPLAKYESITRASVLPEQIQKSVEIIRQAPCDYEFRTTVFSALTLEDFEEIGRWLSGSRRYCLQPVKTGVPLLDGEFTGQYSAPTVAELAAIKERVRPYFQEVIIRD